MGDHLRYPQAAFYLGISTKTLRRLVKANRVRAHRVSAGIVTFSKRDLDRYLEKVATVHTV
jgi:excisionase family DNA binding protein